MRTIRALAAAAALASLLAASGPAAAKIMQLTIAGDPNGLIEDRTIYLGANSTYYGYVVDFVFTYDTDTPIDAGPFRHFALLSARMDVRIPDDQAAIFTPDGDITGTFNIAVDGSSSLYTNAVPGYYVINTDAYLVGDLQSLLAVFPSNGTDTSDQNITYYPDPNAIFVNRTNKYYGNSQYDIQFEKQSNSDTIYSIFTVNHDDSGNINTRYVNFKDITPGGVPEPAAWALMLLGFGGLGTTLRRRRAVGLAV